MARSKRVGASAILALSLIAWPSSAQVRISPDSPHRGETITITADPSKWSDETQRFYKSDQLYAFFLFNSQGLGRPRAGTWTPLTWDGHRFIGQFTLPGNCESGWINLATPERYFETARVRFVCRAPDGSLPPGAIISGLGAGALDKSNWREDVAKDLARLRNVKGHGWEYYLIWLFEWREAKTPTAERLREVERVEREEGKDAGPALLSSLVAGYVRANQPRRAFDKLKELCDRFPESEYTAVVGLLNASIAVETNPEFDDELNRLVEQVANAAPENKGLREFGSRLTTTAHVPLATVRKIATRWAADRPKSMEPHYMLANAIAGVPDLAAEAEAEITKAIDLSLQPHPFDFSERRERQRAFRLRSTLRANRGDLVGAIADARLAQLVADDKTGADDLSAEAELWQRLGYGRKSENQAVEAYQRGSIKAEGLLKDLYAGRTASSEGFHDYLIGILRGSNLPLGLSTRPAPAFSATTLDGAKVDAAALRGKITALEFWFIGCAPCRAERPKLNDLVAEFGDRVRFIGFSRDRAESLKKYLESNPFKYEIVPESDPIALSFGVQSYPTHLILDPAGNIVWTSGTDEDRVERLRGMLFRMVAKAESAKPR